MTSTKLSTKLRKITLSTVTATMLAGGILPSVSFASEPSSAVTETRSVELPSPTGKQILFSEVNAKDIILIDGVTYDIHGNLVVEKLGGIQERGKWSAAVKLIKKAYNKLPSSVRNYINKYTGLTAFLNLIEHYTGKLEDAIYNACIKSGMSKTIANTVTKTIMLFVF